MLNTVPGNVFGETSLHEEQEVVEDPERGEYISNLWSNIRDAFRFLEEHSRQASKQAPVAKDVQRIRKKEKISKMPFVRHNFVRFGKRFTPDASSLKASDLPSNHLAEGGKLQDIVDRILDNSFLLPEQQSSWSNHPTQLTASSDSGLSEFDVDAPSPVKRHLHNFIRIGRQYHQDLNPFSLETNEASSVLNEDAADPHDVVMHPQDKRTYSKFVRIGRK